MHGTQTIDIKSARYSYHIELARKITILSGNSGTGKTTLINTIVILSNNGSKNLTSSVPVIAISDLTDKSAVASIIKSNSASIICIDEGQLSSLSPTLASAINQSNNYFLLVTRNTLPAIPYSPSSLKILVTDTNNRHTLKSKFQAEETVCKPDILICEDEASGLQFFQLFQTKPNTVLTARGKDNVYSLAECISAQNPSKKILIVADGSAFGSCLVKNMQMHTENQRVSLYLPESFEYVLLHSPIFDKDSIVQNILIDPLASVDSSYVSTEQYFTAEIKDAMKRLNQTYSKSKLNPCFYDLCCYKGQDCTGKVKDRSHTKQAELLHRIGKLDLSNI